MERLEERIGFIDFIKASIKEKTTLVRKAFIPLVMTSLIITTSHYLLKDNLKYIKFHEVITSALGHLTNKIHQLPLYEYLPN